MTVYRAHTVVLAYGPEAAVICTEHGILGRYDRTKDAQAVMTAHNDSEHPEEEQ